MGTPGEWENVEQAAMAAQFETNASYVAPPEPPPKTGLMPLTAVDIEAVKGLHAAKLALDARWRAVELEVLEEAPPGARVVNWDLDQGVAAWEVK